MGWLLSPLSWLLLAVLGACAARWWSSRARALCVASAVVAVVAVAAMTPLVANLLVGWLERPVMQSAGCANTPPDIAVVLAGGVDAAYPEEADISALGITSRRRMERAVAWWDAKPGRRLVVAGGPLVAGGVPPSRLMVRYSRQFGVDAGSLQAEESSTNTWENARHLACVPGMPRRVVLVTSAMHLPRAGFAMRHAGFEVCPVPADFRRVALGWPGALIPRSSALRKSEAALHEIVGLVWYWLRAWGESARPDQDRGSLVHNDLVHADLVQGDLFRDDLARNESVQHQGFGGGEGLVSFVSGEPGSFGLPGGCTPCCRSTAPISTPPPAGRGCWK
jgi:uncharacterized SAM-binding protein YcdF (DUF218 family)